MDATGAIKDNFRGWRAAGVPGVLAGLQLALDRYGTKSFREVAQPALSRARAAKSDPLYDVQALARLLGTLAERNTTDSFYRGDIAQVIADAFRRHGGLVTAKDMADYGAVEQEPYRLPWGDKEIDFAPPLARKTYNELFHEHTGVAPEDAAAVAALAKSLGLETANRHPDVIKSDVFEAKVEDALVGPVFVSAWSSSRGWWTRKPSGGWG